MPLILKPDECSNDEYHNGFLKDFYGSSTISSFAYLTPIEAKLKNDEDFADILTLDGQFIRHITNPTAGQNIDVYDLEAGLYLMRTKTAVIRFIKE